MGQPRLSEYVELVYFLVVVFEGTILKCSKFIICNCRRNTKDMILCYIFLLHLFYVWFIYVCIYLNMLVKLSLLQSVILYASIRSEFHLNCVFISWVKYNQRPSTGSLWKWNEIRVLEKKNLLLLYSKVALNFCLHYLKSLEDA